MLWIGQKVLEVIALDTQGITHFAGFVLLLITAFVSNTHFGLLHHLQFVLWMGELHVCIVQHPLFLVSTGDCLE